MVNESTGMPTPSNLPIREGVSDSLVTSTSNLPEMTQLDQQERMHNIAGKVHFQLPFMQKNIQKFFHPSSMKDLGKIGIGSSNGSWIEVRSKRNADIVKIFIKKNYQNYANECSNIIKVANLHEVVTAQVFRFIAGKNSVPKTYLYEEDGKLFSLSRKIGDQSKQGYSKNVQQAEIDLKAIASSDDVSTKESLARSAMRMILVSHLLGERDLKPANMVTDLQLFYRIDFGHTLTLKADLDYYLLDKQNMLSPLDLLERSGFGFSMISKFTPIRSIVEQNLEICKQEILNVLLSFLDLDISSLEHVLTPFEQIASKMDANYLPTISKWIQEQQKSVRIFLNHLQNN